MEIRPKCQTEGLDRLVLKYKRAFNVISPRSDSFAFESELFYIEVMGHFKYAQVD